MTLIQQQGSVETFSAVMPATAPGRFPDAEATVLARLYLSDGQQSIATAMVRLYQSTASLDGVGSAYVDGANLVIPGQFNVIEPGFYRVEATRYGSSAMQGLAGKKTAQRRLLLT